MTRRYIVVVSNLNNDDARAFTAFLRANKMLWWHWIEQCWLIVDRGDDDHQKAIRDYLHELSSSKRAIVIDADFAGYWVGFGPASGEKDMFKWLKSTWDKSE
jgi:hypothetical protein